MRARTPFNFKVMLILLLAGVVVAGCSSTSVTGVASRGFPGVLSAVTQVSKALTQTATAVEHAANELFRLIDPTGTLIAPSKTAAVPGA